MAKQSKGKWPMVTPNNTQPLTSLNISSSKCNAPARYPSGHCQHCGIGFEAFALEAQSYASCTNCQHTICTQHTNSNDIISALSLTAIVAIISSAIYPFLTLTAGGTTNTITLSSLVSHFNSGIFYGLGGIIALSVVIFPLLYLIALFYVTYPLSRGRQSFRHAYRAFHLANKLRPWAMAEVFLIGTSIALIKIVELADVSLNFGFWAFFSVAIFTFIIDQKLCKVTIWTLLSQSTRQGVSI